MPAEAGIHDLSSYCKRSGGCRHAPARRCGHRRRVDHSGRWTPIGITRLTNGFRKKLENHEAAVGLFAACNNLCRVHRTLKITPAMALGVTDHPCSIAERIDAAGPADDEAKQFTLPPVPPPAPLRPVYERPRFTVIPGGWRD